MLVTRVTNATTARGHVGSATLRVVDGPDLGLEIDLPQIGVVIGTDRACDVALTDTFVSRRHCSVAPTRLRYTPSSSVWNGGPHRANWSSRSCTVTITALAGSACSTTTSFIGRRTTKS